MGIQSKSVRPFAQGPGMECTQAAMIVTSHEFSEVASEEITPGTIARMSRLLVQQNEHLDSLISMANGGPDSF
jgi:hypothetical protein